MYVQAYIYQFSKKSVALSIAKALADDREKLATYRLNEPEMWRL